MDRTSIIRGPAVLKIGDKVLYTEENITVNAEVTSTEGKTAIHGKYDEFMDTVVHTISFKPASQCTVDYFNALLMVYYNPTLGASLYTGAPDLMVWSVDGKQYTYKQAALTTMPGLSLAPNMPLYDGEAVFTAIGDSNEDWSTADHFASMASVPFTDSSFLPSHDIRVHYSAAWGTAPWNNFETESGFKVSFDLQLADVPSDVYGIVDKTIVGLSSTITFTPQGITPEQVLEVLGIQGAGARRGRSMVSSGRDLVLDGGDDAPEFTFYNATLKTNPTQFGSSVNRVGELSLTSMRSMTGGAMNPVFLAAAVPIPAS